MYYNSRLGQEDTTVKAPTTTQEETLAVEASEIIEAPKAEELVATDSPTSKVREQVEEVRAKAGLPPLSSLNIVIVSKPAPPRKKPNFAIGGIALLVVLFILLSK